MLTATSPRNRVKAALSFRKPDHLPIDFGGSTTSGMHASVVGRLRDYYGLDRRPVKVIEPMQMLGEIEEDLKRAMGIATEGVFARQTVLGFPNEGWQEWRAPWGQDLLVPSGFRTRIGRTGGLLIYPAGDTSALPSAAMGRSGFFFDALPRHIAQSPTEPAIEDNLQEYGLLAATDLAQLAREVEWAHATGRAVVATVGGTSFGDLSLIPGVGLADPRGIRDIEEWFVAMIDRPEFVREIFERQCEIGLKNLARIHAAVGEKIDVLVVSNTDFGTQNSMFVSPKLFRGLYAPFLKEVNAWVHANTSWKTFCHSCGAIGPLIGDLVKVGFDILNPLQCSAKGMDPRALKDRWGGQIVFWGGGVDTMRILPHGTPDQVREVVRERCRILGEGGGFVFNAVHNLQAGTPVENIVAMVEEARRF